MVKRFQTDPLRKRCPAPGCGQGQQHQHHGAKFSVSEIDRITLFLMDKLIKYAVEFNGLFRVQPVISRHQAGAVDGGLRGTAACVRNDLFLIPIRSPRSAILCRRLPGRFPRPRCRDARPAACCEMRPRPPLSGSLPLDSMAREHSESRPMERLLKLAEPTNSRRSSTTMILA